MFVKISADFSRDRESRRHRQADASHLGEIRAFAAEERFHAARSIGTSVAKVVDANEGVWSRLRNALLVAVLGLAFFGFVVLKRERLFLIAMRDSEIARELRTERQNIAAS